MEHQIDESQFSGPNDAEHFTSMTAMLLVAVLYPSWSLLLWKYFPLEYDEPWGRLGVAAYALACFFAVDRLSFLKKHLTLLSSSTMIVLTLHFYYLIFKGGLTDIYIFGSTVVSLGISIGYERLRAYQIQTAITLGLAAVATWEFYPTNSQSPAFFAMLLTIHTVCYFMLASRVNALKSLKDARFTNLEMRKLFLEKELTQVREESQKLKQLSFTDAVTGLPNRYYLERQLHLALDRYHQERMPFAILFMDLDGFKVINDTLGHKVGDESLVTASQRIRQALRKSDTLARVGGDEFVAILSGLEDGKIIDEIVRKLKVTVAEPLEINGSACQLGTSVGVALCPRDAAVVADLMHHADQKMYQDKVKSKR